MTVAATERNGCRLSRQFLRAKFRFHGFISLWGEYIHVMFSNDSDDSVVLHPFDGLALAYGSEQAEDDDDRLSTSGNHGFLSDL